jgi:hypothetical protein
MPSVGHLITQMPQTNGGAVLRTRSDASSEDMIFFWIILAMMFVILGLIAKYTCWGNCLDEGKSW